MGKNVRLEGLTLTVKDVALSRDFYVKKLGFQCEWNAAPHFAMVRVGGPGGGTIGLLAWSEAKKQGAATTTPAQKRAVHVELGTDDLDGLHERLVRKGVVFHSPPHDEPWERSATAFDPDGYAVEFSQGRRGEKKKK
jgi:catechol 2,3-dioxygenase-like lactoylglutathione lyase family enzyme